MRPPPQPPPRPAPAQPVPTTAAATLPARARGARRPARPVCGAWLAGGMALLLSACGTPKPAEPVALYRLPFDPQPPLTAVSANPATAALRWELQWRGPWPDATDRDALLVPAADTRLLRPSGYRWAEPLRDVLPRLLQQDLQALLGPSQVAVAPLPAGWQADRRWQLVLLRLEPDAEARQVLLDVRWQRVDSVPGTAAPGGSLPGTMGSVMMGAMGGAMAVTAAATPSTAAAPQPTSAAAPAAAPANAPAGGPLAAVARPPLTCVWHWQAPLAGSGPDGLARGYRAAVRALAVALAGAGDGPCPAPVAASSGV